MCVCVCCLLEHCCWPSAWCAGVWIWGALRAARCAALSAATCCQREWLLWIAVPLLLRMLFDFMVSSACTQASLRFANSSTVSAGPSLCGRSIVKHQKNLSCVTHGANAKSISRMQAAACCMRSLLVPVAASLSTWAPAQHAAAIYCACERRGTIPHTKHTHSIPHNLYTIPHNSPCLPSERRQQNDRQEGPKRHSLRRGSHQTVR